MLIAARRVDYQGEPARLEVYTPITDRKRTEAALSRRNAVLDAVTYAAKRIIGTTDWRLAMPELLARLGVATQVSRAFLFEIQPAPGGTGMARSCQFLWSAPGIQRLSDDHPRLRNVPIPTAQDSQLGDLLARRSQGEVIQITRTQTRDDARKLFDETETLSLLSVPIMVDGMIWGALGFDDCCRERVWDKMEIELLKSATALIAEAIERARAEGKLRERDSQLVEAQRIASVGSWVLDFATDHVSWSDEGLRIFGFSPGGGAWTQQENLQYIHPDDRRRVAEADATARLTGQQFEIEYRIIRPDGEIRTVFERTEPAFDEHGEPLRLIGTVRDVTELRTAEARLRESEERYALAAKGAGVGLWDWDISTDKAYFSPRLHEISARAAAGSDRRSPDFSTASYPQTATACAVIWMGASQDSGPSSSTSSVPCTPAAVCAGCWSGNSFSMPRAAPTGLSARSATSPSTSAFRKKSFASARRFTETRNWP